MASLSAIGPVQVAMYGVLSTDLTLLTLAAGGVHNDVPEGLVYPHVLIVRPSETPRNTFGGPNVGIGRTVLARAHIYSRYQGDKEAADILSRIVALLDFQPIAVSGFSSAIWEYEGGRGMIEDVNKIETRHLVGEFRVTVMQ